MSVPEVKINSFYQNLFFHVMAMKTAFFFRLVFPPPSAGPEIFAFADGPCAWGAANTWETLVVQGIVRYVMLFDVILYFVQCPVIKRVKFHQAILLVPFYIAHKLAVGRLIGADTGYPAVITLQGAFQRFNFAYVAAFFTVLNRFIKAVGAFF